MSILIRWAMLIPREGSVEVTDRQLDAMVNAGVDVTDEEDVAHYFKKNLGKQIAPDVWLPDVGDVADDWDTSYPPEFEEWYAEGEAPDRFWPHENT